MKNTEHTELPVFVKEYIGVVIGHMGYRRVIRQEVRQELVDHFVDALSDCSSEEERNACARALIQEFGDGKLLGTLLRRAKKRCRPFWRTAVTRFFQAAGVLFVLLVLYAGWFFAGKPIITTNYLEVLNRQVRPLADENQNAWPYYKQATDRYVECSEKEFDFSMRSLSTVTSKDREVLIKWIADNQATLDLVRQGNQKPYYWQVYRTEVKDNTAMFDVLLPHLTSYRHLARLYCWQALFAAEKGDMQKAFDSVFEAYSFGQHVRGQNNTLIEQLVAMAVEGASTGTIRLLLKDHPEAIDAETSKAALERFGKLVLAESFAVNYESEKIFFYDEIQRSFTQTRLGKSHLYLQRVGKHGLGFEGYGKTTKTLFHVLFTHPDREQTLADAGRFYEAMDNLKLQTPGTLHKQKIDMNERIEELAGDNVLFKILMPSLEKVYVRSYRNQADSVATLTLLGIFHCHKVRNGWPASLEVLVREGMLVNLPMDPFADAPLVYKKTADGFTLYSVGLDFTDNGGVPGTDSNGKTAVWGENGDAVFWPIQTDNG